MADVKRLQIMIDEDLDAALDRMALKEGTSKAALIRRFVRERVKPLPPLRGDPPRLGVAHIPETMEREALGWLRRHDERSYSFVDATSFALMRSMKIKDALAFDGDFSAAGFRALRA